MEEGEEYLVKESILIEVNKFVKLKIGMVVKSDTEDQNYRFKVINKFSYYGNEYITITPRAYVTIDLSSALDKGERYSPNSSVNLNKMDLFKFCERLKRLLSIFQEEVDLFYTINGTLTLNSEKGFDAREVFMTREKKSVVLSPCVVHDEENTEIVYEGIVMCINSFDNFAYLTYEEAKFMLDTLTKLDLTSLGMQMLNLYLLTLTQESETVHRAPIVQEDETLAPGATRKYVPIKKESKIPEI